MGFLLYNRIAIYIRLMRILKALVILLISVLLLLLIIHLFFPSFGVLLNEQILPYAFEFLYSVDKSGTMETASTNHLKQMWVESDFNYIEFFLGSGHYTNIDGSYYMHVDPGILRHTLFMGIGGYIILLIYQFNLFPIWKMKGDTKYYYSLILLFLIVMEFKGVNIGLNKFAFAITLLFSFSYFYLQYNKNNS